MNVINRKPDATCSLKESTILELNMKPAIVADEMFPEGAGPYMDLEEVF